MKKLREQLEEILPQFLSHKPEEAINGTELLKKLKVELPNENESSLRVYLSLMANDSSSCIAKLANKHGYYFRTISEQETVKGLTPTEEKNLEKELRDNEARTYQREEKFRSIFMKYYEQNNNVFTMLIEHTKGQKTISGLNKWKYPDVIIVNWEVGDVVDGEFKLNKDLLEVRKSLGEQPFKLTSCELKVELKLSTFRENFFQCVSNSKWAHEALLAVATTINDSKLKEELSRLGSSFDVSIVSFGLTDDILDKFPSSTEIDKMPEEEFEDRVAKYIDISTITIGSERDNIDWEHIRDIKKQTSEFAELLEWLSTCLYEGKPYTVKDFRSLKEFKSKYK